MCILWMKYNDYINYRLSYFGCSAATSAIKNLIKVKDYFKEENYFIN